MDLDGFDYVLPAYDALIESSAINKLGGNIYCSTPVFNEFERKNLAEYTEGEATKIEGKGLKMAKSKLKSNLIDKLSSSSLKKASKDVKHFSSIDIDKSKVQTIAYAVALADSGYKVLLVSGDGSIKKAYTSVLDKKTYLNKKNFALAGVEVLDGKDSSEKTLESKVDLDFMKTPEVIGENNQELINDLKEEYEYLSFNIKRIMKNNRGKLPSVDNNPYSNFTMRNNSIARMKEIESEAKSLGQYFGEKK